MSINKDFNCPICKKECDANDGMHCEHFIGWTDDFETVDMLNGIDKCEFKETDIEVELNGIIRVFRQ